MPSFDFRGKKAFIAGIGDDQGFGWAIAKALAEAGVTLIVGTWPPVYNILIKSLQSGRLDESRKLSDGSLMEFAKIYPFDAAFDTPDQVPQEIKESRRYKDFSGYTTSEVASQVREEFGEIDFLVHSLANGPEAAKPLLETSRTGYLAAISASAYSNTSLIAHFAPFMKRGGASLSLTYIASERVIPGYGGGLSGAKAALESDTRTLAWEAGQKYGIRVNTISAGPWGSRAAKAIGFIDTMIAYSKKNAPLSREFSSEDVGNAALFLLSPLAAAITGVTLYVDNGLHAMGSAMNASISTC